MDDPIITKRISEDEYVHADLNGQGIGRHLIYRMQVGLRVTSGR